MSQPTSPVAGSPTGAAPSSPEEVLAQVLVQIQQGQAQIAKDTREGLQKLSEGLQSAIQKPGIVDVKGIGKPDVLKGTHEQVQKHWKSWCYKFETWFCRPTFQCGKVLQGTFSVCDTTKPLLPIGKMVEHGHTVTMTPNGGYIQLKGSKTKITIYQRKGVCGKYTSGFGLRLRIRVFRGWRRSRKTSQDERSTAGGGSSRSSS